MTSRAALSRCLTFLVGSVAVAGTALPANAQCRGGGRDQSYPSLSSVSSLSDSRPFGSYGESPIAEIRELPSAAARAAIARAEVRRAHGDLYRAVNRLHEDARNTPELREAIDAEKAAYAELDAARNRVIARLWNDPKYAASMSLAQTLDEKIQDLREQPKPPHHEIVATALVKMRYSTSGRSIEAAKLAEDEQVTAARQRLLDAGGLVAEIRERLAREVRRDPAFLAASRSHDDARVAHLGASAYLNAAVNARARATDYAYDRQRINRYNYHYTGYGIYGY